MDYVSTQNEYLIIEAVICFDYSNIHHLYLIIQYIIQNNQMIKMNN